MWVQCIPSITSQVTIPLSRMNIVKQNVLPFTKTCNRFASIITSTNKISTDTSESIARLTNPYHRKGAAMVLHPLILPDSARTNSPIPRYQLSKTERLQANNMRRIGSLRLGNSSTDSVRTTAYHECEIFRIPYICVDRDGSCVYVDAATCAGKGLSRDFAPVIASLARMRDELVAARNETNGNLLQVTSADALLEQTKKLAIGALEGSNEFKIAEDGFLKKDGPALPPAFYVFTSGKAQAYNIADRLAKVGSSTDGISPIEKWKNEQAAKLEKRRERRNALLERRLRKLVSDPAKMRTLRVKAGALDGYISSRKEVETSSNKD